MHVNSHHKFGFSFCLSALLASPAVLAVPFAGLDFTGSGFLTFAAGEVLGGSVHGPNGVGFNCPCQISDYSQGSVFESNSTNLGVDSKLGLQGSAVYNDKLSMTGQVMVRGAQNGMPDLEWLYTSYKITPNTTLQIGRKRLPLFYYSETQDLGFSYPWVHLPPQTYGWDVNNYNGANLLRRDNWGSWSTALNIFAGFENNYSAPYNNLYSGKSYRIDNSWSDIIGSELTFSRDWFEGRFMYMQSLAQIREVGDGTPGSGTWDWGPKFRQRFFGVSTSITPDDWVIMSEILFTKRDQYGGDFAATASIGYRFGNFLPLFTYAVYKQSIYKNGGLTEDTERHHKTSYTLRYDINSYSDVKMQLDIWVDHSAASFNALYGNSTLLSLSYDMVF